MDQILSKEVASTLDGIGNFEIFEGSEIGHFGGLGGPGGPGDPFGRVGAAQTPQMADFRPLNKLKLSPKIQPA